MNHQLAIDVIKNQLRELRKEYAWFCEITTMQGHDLYVKVENLKRMISEHEKTLRDLESDVKHGKNI